jgi:hypothetical protein
LLHLPLVKSAVPGSLPSVTPGVVVPDLPLNEIVTLARELQPRFIGLSCALPSAVPPAVDLITRLRGQLEPGLCCRYVLGGFAFRLGGGVRPSAVAPGIEVVVDLDWFYSLRSPLRGSSPGPVPRTSPSLR